MNIIGKLNPNIPERLKKTKKNTPKIKKITNPAINAPGFDLPTLLLLATIGAIHAIFLIIHLFHYIFIYEFIFFLSSNINLYNYIFKCYGSNEISDNTLEKFLNKSIEIYIYLYIELLNVPKNKKNM